MPTATAYRDWAATVTSQGGVVTVLPTQAGRGANVPAAKFTEAQITSLKLGPPDYWQEPLSNANRPAGAPKVSGIRWGFYMAGTNVAAGAAVVADQAADGPDGPPPSWWDAILGNLGSLGDKLRTLGTVVYWLLIVGLIALAALELWKHSKRPAVSA